MDILLDLLESMGKNQKFYGPEWGHTNTRIQAAMVDAIGTGDLEPDLGLLVHNSQLPYALFYCGIALHFYQPSLMKLM